MTNKRKAIELKIQQTLSALDPSGINAKKYADMFASMDDKAFAKWMEAFKANEREKADIPLRKGPFANFLIKQISEMDSDYLKFIIPS